MGNCCCHTSAPPLLGNPIYDSHVSLRVKEKDHYGRSIGTCGVTFDLTLPFTERQTIQLDQHLIRVSSCLLPSVDPSGRTTKDCQDYFFTAYYGSAVLAGIFDGHGLQGQAAARFSADTLKGLFKNNYEKLIEHPARGLEQMLLDCDEQLRASDIDTSLSGTTAVLLFIHRNHAYVGSLGDSRAVLAVPGLPEHIPSRPNNRFVRTANPLHSMKCINLSYDQRPDDPGEYERIIQAGGRVKQVADEMGKGVGPYRVWTQTRNLPGLAMSRSLGDDYAKGVGVIATPVVESAVVPTPSFLILASDGVWNIMSSQEATNFVEAFRHKTSPSADTTSKYPLTVMARVDRERKHCTLAS